MAHTSFARPSFPASRLCLMMGLYILALSDPDRALPNKKRALGIVWLLLKSIRAKKFSGYH